MYVGATVSQTQEVHMSVKTWDKISVRIVPVVGVLALAASVGGLVQTAFF